MTDGSKANKTGKILEQFIRNLLEQYDYKEYQGNKKDMFFQRHSITGKQYKEQVPCGKSIYDTKRKCDFLVINPEKFDDGLIIECKWQQSSGSVDEKYPFTYFNIQKIGVPTIVLIDGNGYKPKAKEWLKEQVIPESALIGVYSMMEFQTIVNNGFLN